MQVASHGADRARDPLDNQEHKRMVWHRLTSATAILASSVVRAVIQTVALVVAVVALPVAGFLVSVAAGFAAIFVAAVTVVLVLGWV